ncbi:M16 family metallopeptidase [Bathymodiolus septemdierum thioautotrophic gill symbiont]|uniref:Peptidase M16 n=1 Tax=endosymbiont of Bathymodiolus septemdierum str. Myojin knoll TaxID=1303921 RepID=A0A0P0UTC8_9GAMM|nr:pitrilysin family protein [Bathymodiolus septemdierum thioautotrophic gill symbiont]BAS68126.1 peptidase M16 [endosymbiont of Bathymodiolus septemdierum str. Myojin knoll]
MVKTLGFIILIFHQWAWSTSLQDAGVSVATLDNGLKIIVKVDNRAPVFISQIWYQVGASDERRPNTGLSHMLEHMMFKGTKRYKAGEFSTIIARNGGTDNAFTSKDYTAYYQKMHKSKLALALKMEADRMQNLTFSDEELSKERQVVIEERRMRVEDNPNAKVYENLRLISFDKKGAYHTPVIGFKADIESYKLQDLRDWYEKYYAPNNATLVVVGDVQADEVVALAKQYFGGYQHNPNITHADRPSIEKINNARILKLKAELPFYILSFPVPSLKTNENDAYDLDMLAYVLDNGLSKTLIREQQIASDISVGYQLYDRYNTIFTISFIAAKGISNKVVLSAIKTQVAELIKNPSIIKDELSRTKTQLESSFVFEQDRISTQSYYLGMLSTVGIGIEKMFSYVGKMNAINAKQVADIAKQYLDFSKANSVELIPQGIQ